MAGRILPGMEEQIDRNNLNGQGGLRRKKGLNGGIKFLIVLAVLLVVFGTLVLVGFFVGNHLMESNLGVSLWTTFDVIGDLNDSKREEVVTNPFTSMDEDGFYVSLNNSLYLSESADTKSLVNDVVADAMSGAVDTDQMQDSLINLFNSINIDRQRLSAYDGWKPDKVSTDYLSEFTDRELAAFVSAIISDVLDDAMSSSGNTLPYGIKASEVLLVEQIILRKGADIADATDRALIGVDDNHTYLTMTASLQLLDMMDQIMMSPEMGFSGYNSIRWLVNMLLPKEVFFTMTFDMIDAAQKNVYEFNHLAHAKCNFKPVGAESETEMTKMDRFVMYIDAIVHNTADSSFSFIGILDDVVGSIKDFLVVDPAQDFSLGNMIELSTLKAEPDGSNSFKMDMFGSFMDMVVDTIGLQTSDIITILQAMLCTDTKNIIKNADGARLYSDNNAQNAGGVTTYGYHFISVSNEPDLPTDLPPDASGWLDDSDRDALMNGYSKEILEQLAKTYGISETYDDGQGNEVEYTMDDILGALGVGEPTAVSDQLKSEVVAKVYDYDVQSLPVPRLDVTDKMLAAIIQTKLDDTGIADYDVTLYKIAIKEVIDEDNIKHSVASVYGTLDLDSFVAGNGFMSDLISSIFEDNNQLIFNAEIDITPDMDSADKITSVIYINGLKGEENVLNGLSTEDLLNSIKVFSDFDEASLYAELQNMVDNALNSMESSGINIEFTFVPSPPNTDA